MSARKEGRWDRSGPEAKELTNLFNLHKATNGKAGVDPNLKKPGQIKDQVYHKYDAFQKLNIERFPNNFRNLAADWLLNEAINTGRKGEKIAKKLFLNSFYYV